MKRWQGAAKRLEMTRPFAGEGQRDRLRVPHGTLPVPMGLEVDAAIRHCFWWQGGSSGARPQTCEAAEMLLKVDLPQNDQHQIGGWPFVNLRCF